MKLTKYFVLILLSSLIGSVLNAQDQSYPFVKEKEYNNGQTKYYTYDRKSTFVEMSDGVKLAVDIMEPTGGVYQEKSPVIFIFTPYGRSYLVPEIKAPARLASKVAGAGWGPDYDMGNYYKTVRLLLRNGYRIVVADMRGTGASFGYQMPLEPRLGIDGKELVDWIEAQEWCNGNVGMMGASFLGWAQFLVAAQKPNALKCIMPEVMGFDVYSTGIRPGGIPAQRWINGFSDRLQGFNLNVKELNKGLLPTLPVIDEDKDGDFQDEWPNIDRETLLKGYFLPTYSDKKPRPNSLYYQAILDHLDNFWAEGLLEESFKFYDSYGPAPFENISYQITSPGYYSSMIAESGVAIYNIGGWFDGFTKGTPMWYATLSETNPSYLMMAPRFHIPVVPPYYKSFVSYKGNYNDELKMEQLRFFDHYLKGISSGIEKDSAVKIFVMHEGWVKANSWPLENSGYQRYFFQKDGSLAKALKKKGKLTYEVDFDVRSNYGKRNGNRWLMYQSGPGEVMNRKDIDNRTLAIESQELTEDLIIAGHPIVKIFLSNDQPYGDLFVYLEEVDKNGNAFYITEGQLRGGWATSYDYDVVAQSKIDVKPNVIPWKGFREEQWVDSIFAKNEVVEMMFDLLPTAYKFRKGNKIRISLAGADYGNFQLNPGLCPEDDPRKCKETIYQVICTDLYSSQILLPVLEN
ncbi:MAG: CocE/NonD family hydrolase [Bacteroidia bacterium]|nr:CocE/NonD family hydrolase [Bacteroidia bacterium]